MSSKIKEDTIENIAGSGNVSLGSGHNLVVPGNITGQGTTTLTGDLAVDTTTLKVDSSNNLVGIGTSSPLSLTGNAAPGLTVSSNGPFILLQDANNANKVRYISNNTGELQLGQVNDDGSTNKTLHLNVSTDGRVTMPSQPSFRAVGNNANWVNVTSGNQNIIEFDLSPPHNVGGHYSTANDRFTAPVAGRYLIGYHCYVRNNAALSDGTGAYGYIRLMKNGSNISALNNIFGYSNDADSDVHRSLTVVIELAANDYMQVGLQGVGGTVQHYGNSSVFYGHLLS